MNNISFAEILSVITLLVSVLTVIFLYQFQKLNKEIMNRAREKKVRMGLQREKLEDAIYKGVEDLTKDPVIFSDSNHLLLDASNSNGLKSKKEVPNFSYFEDLGIAREDFTIVEKSITCLMPFNTKYDSLYATIKIGCEYNGFKCFRTDEEEIENSANLRKFIVSKIIQSQVIIAVLDGRNPNVLYEVGIAHAIGKLVILLVKREQTNELPENLKGNRLLIYRDFDDLFERLSKTLTQIEYD